MFMSLLETALVILAEAVSSTQILRKKAKHRSAGLEILQFYHLYSARSSIRFLPAPSSTNSPSRTNLYPPITQFFPTSHT